MTTFAIKCPYCLRDNTSFTVEAVKSRGLSQRSWTNVETFATCNACGHGVVASLEVSPNLGAAEQVVLGNGRLPKSSYLEIGPWFPRAPTPDVPDHLPDDVAEAFTEAEKLRLAAFRGPSGNAYRRALEAALKAVNPALTGSLYTRIERLASDGHLTPAMKDFAHRIRNLGNAASHETHSVEEDEIDDLAIFTKLFLMYQFTLPGMLPTTDDHATSTGA